MWTDTIKEKLFWGVILFACIFAVLILPSIQNFFKDTHLDAPAKPDEVRSVFGYSMCEDTDMRDAREDVRKWIWGVSFPSVGKVNGTLALMDQMDYTRAKQAFSDTEIMMTFTNCRTDESAGKPLGYWECYIYSPCKQFVNKEGIIEGYKKAFGKISFRKIDTGNYTMVSCEERIRNHDTESACYSDYG